VHRVIEGVAHISLIMDEDAADITGAILDVVSSVGAYARWSGDPERNRGSIPIYLCWSRRSWLQRVSGPMSLVGRACVETQ
jgi:hypothetical protein